MSTIVIHGTLARDELWWRSEGGFLAALAQGMAAGGRTPHDIWMVGGRSVTQQGSLQPSGSWSWLSGRKAPPFDQIDGHFCWSGANVHSERLDGGAALARYLAAMASISRGETIDIIAHSHGANVVKAATNHVGRQVPIGRLVFLAAPHCGKAQISWTEVNYPYRLHASWASSRGTRPVLNAYCMADPVQSQIAGAAPDSWGAPPGLPGGVHPSTETRKLGDRLATRDCAAFM